MMPDSTRKGGWIQTFTGKAFYPLDPRPEDVSMFDIAHSLSQLCRYAGHTRRFYSVAEHCVVMSWAIPQEFAAWALMHDAAEAYIVDVPRPIKRQPEMLAYRNIEDHLITTIATKFNLKWDVMDLGDFPEAVHEYDARILLDERAALLGQKPQNWAPELEAMRPLGVKISGWQPDQAETLFLNRARELELIR